MCLPFGVLFYKIWYSDRWVSSQTKEPKFKNWVYFEQIIVKSMQFGQNLVLFCWKRVYWWVGNWAKTGIEKVKFSSLGRHIHVWFWLKYPCGGGGLYVTRSRKMIHMSAIFNFDFFFKFNLLVHFLKMLVMFWCKSHCSQTSDCIDMNNS